MVGMKKDEGKGRERKNRLFFFWGCNGVYLHVLSPLSLFFIILLFCLLGYKSSKHLFD